MLVYRVELPDGTGPWCNPKGQWHGSSGYSRTGYDRSLSSWSNPCSISAAWPHHEKHLWRFGFTNWNQFFSYCDGGLWDKSRERKLKALNIIKEKEMVISVYDIPDLAVIKDDTQCVFRIAEATLVERLDSLSDIVMDQLSIFLGEPTKKEKDEKEAGDTSFIRYPGHQTNYEGITI